MPKVNCTVIGYSNSTYKGTASNISYLFIYIRFMVPCKQLREAWITSVKQEPFDKNGSWKPAPSDHVCSIYFFDGLETDENPIPTLFLGYKDNII